MLYRGRNIIAKYVKKYIKEDLSLCVTEKSISIVYFRNTVYCYAKDIYFKRPVFKILDPVLQVEC